jgi:hypothetical protein
MLNRKILTVILLPMLLIPMISFSYAHIRRTVMKKYKLHVEFGYIDIETYKIYSPWDDDDITDQLLDDTLYIDTTVFPGWYAWVGLIIKNNGIFPVNVEEPAYQVMMIPPDSVTWDASEFYYGPYSTAGFNPTVWNGITGSNYQDKLDPDDGVIDAESDRTYPPLDLEPPPANINKCKLVVWIYISIVDGPSDFIMELSIIISGTITDVSWIEQSSWTFGDDQGIPSP